MRLWTVHPGFLDPPGLTALWREALLAREVLLGRTRGYRHHPQLERFRAHADPVAAINRYLRDVYDEASRRGYAFGWRKLARRQTAVRLPETRGQLEHEWRHLLRKLRLRAPALHRKLKTTTPAAHPLFRLVAGGVRAWERAPRLQ